MKLIFMLLLLVAVSFPQGNAQGIKTPVGIELSWTRYTGTDVAYYSVVSVQGQDTTLFPFNTGSHPDSVWYLNEQISDWWLLSTWKTYCLVRPYLGFAGTSYLRLGVYYISNAGEKSTITCIPKVIVIKTPVPVPIGVRAR